MLSSLRLARRPARTAKATLLVRLTHSDSRQKLANYRAKTEVDLSNGEIWKQSENEIRWLEEHAGTAQQGAGEDRERRVAGMVDRMVDQDEPLAYVLGWQPFGPLKIQCKPPTLIPRPETEFLTEHIADKIIDSCSRQSDPHRRLRVLDLCTGSGCIALLLQHRLEQARVAADITAVDKSKASIQLAQLNQVSCASESIARPDSERVTEMRVGEMDLFDDLALAKLLADRGPFDLIISNPPYIPTSEWRALDNNVRSWEAAEALIGDIGGTSDGLAFYRRLAHLTTSMDLFFHSNTTVGRPPCLVVEVGHNQAHRVQAIFAATGAFTRTTIWCDPWKVQRGVMAWR